MGGGPPPQKPRNGWTTLVLVGLVVSAAWTVGPALHGPEPALPFRPSSFTLGSVGLAQDRPSCTGCVVSNITVGGQPFDSAYDRAKGEVYVASEDGGNVTVISVKTETTVANIPTGAAPTGIVYDAGMGELYVANANANSISIVNDTSNTVVSTLNGVSNYLNAVGYDPGTSEVFATVGNSLDVIADSNNSILRNILVNTDPYSIAYDSGRGELFVPCYYSEVYVVSDRTDTVVATIPVGSSPEGAVYDSGKGEIFVTNSGSDNVSVISDVTDSVVANIPVGSQPYGIGYDPGAGLVFVANANSQNLTVISDVSNKVVGGTPLPSFPDNLVYDPTNNQVYVGTNTAVGTEAVVNEGSSIPLSVTASAGPSWGPAWFHTNFTAFPAGGSGSYTSWAWHFGDGTTSTLQSPSHVYSTKGNYTAWVNVTDSAGKTFESNSILITATPPTPPVVISSFTASPSTIPLGGSTFYNTSASGGTGALSYSYAGLPPGCSTSNAASLTCSPSSAGTFTTRVYVNDTASRTATATAPLVVSPPKPSPHYGVGFAISPIACGPVAFNGTGQSSGSNVSFLPGSFPATANPCSNFAFQQWNSTGGVAPARSSSASTIVSVAGNGSLTAWYVWSGKGGLVATVDFSIAPPSCGPITFGGLSENSGGSASFSTGNYSASATSCTSETFSNWGVSGSLTLPTLGSNPTTVWVKGAGTLYANYTASTPPATNPVLEVSDLSVLGGSTTLNVGQAYDAEVNVTNVGWTGSVALGSSVAFSYYPPGGGAPVQSTGHETWYGWVGSVENSTPSFGGGHLGNLTYNWTYTAFLTGFVPNGGTGLTRICVNATATNEPPGAYATGANQMCVHETFVYNPPNPVSATISANVTHGYAPLSVQLSAVATGGVPPYVYNWYTGASCPSSGRDLNCTFAGTGSFEVKASIADSYGYQVVRWLNITVLDPLSLTLAAAPPSIALGGWTNLTATAMGNRGALTFTWPTLPPGCAASDLASLACRPSEQGTLPAEVVAVDPAGDRATAWTNLTVSPAAPASGSSTSGTLLGISYVLWGVLGAAVAMGLVLVLIVLHRRRRASASTPPPPPPTGSAPPSPPGWGFPPPQ